MMTPVIAQNSLLYNGVRRNLKEAVNDIWDTGDSAGLAHPSIRVEITMIATR